MEKEKRKYSETFKSKVVKSVLEGKEKIKNWVKFYNEERAHRSIEMLTPSKAYQLNGQLKRMWKNYYGEKKSIHQLADG